MGYMTSTQFVIPAKAGIQRLLDERRWVPAFAGTTISERQAGGK
jgi:hypothetical protein